jgi:hypothetical protein
LDCKFVFIFFNENTKSSYINELQAILKDRLTMKKSILTFLISFISITTYCQTKKAILKLNFDFEIAEKGRPFGWNNFGSPNYILALDSTNIKSGKYSASIEFKEGNPDFKAWAFTIPDNYAGKKITLTGYIKDRERYRWICWSLDEN